MMYILSLLVTILIADFGFAQPYEPIFLYDQIGEPNQHIGQNILIPMGDQDGDGFDDILYAVCDSLTPSICYNHLRIVYGGISEPYRTLDFAHTTGFENCFRCTWFQWGNLPSCADYNGDGYEDILMDLNSNDFVLTRQYLFLGGPALFDTLWDWRSDSFQQHIYTHSTLGDFDANGRADFLQSVQDCVKVAFFSGSWPDFPSNPTWDYFRPALSYSAEHGSGDITGDGWPDFVFSAFDLDGGTDYYDFWFGGSGADSIPDITLTYPTNAYHTSSWTILGDVNGDGTKDLIALTYENEPDYSISIFYGGTPLDFVNRDILLNHPSTPPWFFPFPVVNLGDLNGDGCEDIGFYQRGNFENPGYIFIYLGGRPMDPNWDLRIFPYFDNTFAVGYRLSSAGDFNGDGINDWMFSSFDSEQSRGRVTVVAGDTRFGMDAGEKPTITPKNFSLGTPYPNPFNGTVTIPLTISGIRPQLIDISIYNVLGQKIFTWGNSLFMPGSNQLQWDGKNDKAQQVSSGNYYVRATIGNQISSVKLQYIE